MCPLHRNNHYFLTRRRRVNQMTESTTYQILLWMSLLPLGVIAFLIMFPLNLIWLAWAIHYFI